MKARRVKGLKPEMGLADAAERIVRTRLEELHAFPQALDADEVEALRRRAAAAVARPVFPHDRSGHRYPWPLV